MILIQCWQNERWYRSVTSCRVVTASRQVAVMLMAGGSGVLFPLCWAHETQTDAICRDTAVQWLTLWTRTLETWVLVPLLRGLGPDQCLALCLSFLICEIRLITLAVFLTSLGNTSLVINGSGHFMMASYSLSELAIPSLSLKPARMCQCGVEWVKRAACTHPV